MKPGKGAAFVRSKLKNCLNGGNVEKTFRAGEQLNLADLIRREVQYTYQDGDNVGAAARPGPLPCLLQRALPWAVIRSRDQHQCSAACHILLPTSLRLVLRAHGQPRWPGLARACRECQPAAAT